MSEEEVDNFNWRGESQYIGSKLKDNYTWDGSNESQFSAVPAGWYNNYTGIPGIQDLDFMTYIWSSTIFSDEAATNGDDEGIFRRLDTDKVSINREFSKKIQGHSIRCLRD